MPSLMSRLIIIPMVAVTFSSANLYAQSFFGNSSGNQKNEQPTTGALTPQEYKTKVDTLTKEYEKELRQRASERFVKPAPLPGGGGNPPNQPYGAAGTQGAASPQSVATNPQGGHPSVISSQAPTTSPPTAAPQPQLPPQTQPPPTLKAPTQPQPATGSSTVTSPASQPSYTGFGSGGKGGSQSGGQWNVKY